MSLVKSCKFTKAKILETIKSRSRPGEGSQPSRKYKHIQVAIGKREFDGKLLYTEFPREVNVYKYYIDGSHVFFSVAEVASYTNNIDGTGTSWVNGIGYNSSFQGLSFHAWSSPEPYGYSWSKQWFPWYKLEILDVIKEKNEIVAIRTKKCTLIVKRNGYGV